MVLTEWIISENFDQLLLSRLAQRRTQHIAAKVVDINDGYLDLAAKGSLQLVRNFPRAQGHQYNLRVVRRNGVVSRAIDTARPRASNTVKVPFATQKF